MTQTPKGRFCTVSHAIEYAQDESRRKAAREKLRRHEAAEVKKAKAQERREHRKAKERIKTRGDWAREAQDAYNKHERASRVGQGCYTCGAPDDGSRQFHCGHYLTRGARPEHRFNHDNTRKQCSRCNNFLSGNVAVFRENLIKEIGLTRVEAMECDHAAKKYTIEDLKEIKRKYLEKCRSIENLN